MAEGVKNYIAELKEVSDKIDHDKVEEIINILLDARKNEKTVFIIGNGGSASTSSHFACDLGKGTIKNLDDKNEKRFRVISLTDNIATMTAYGNDLSYSEIFSQPLMNLIREGDVVITITASGNSKNILQALKLANESGAVTIGFLGFDGGQASKLAKHNIIIPSRNYGIIEDLHLVLEHSICERIRNAA